MKFGRQQTHFVQYKVRYYLWKNLTKADKNWNLLDRFSLYNESQC